MDMTTTATARLDKTIAPLHLGASGGVRPRLQVAGFTLVELMIVVAVVSLLALVAVPAYTDAVAKTRRAEARSAIMQAATALERFYTSNNTYTTTLSAAGAKAFSGDTLASSAYTISVAAGTSGIISSYVITATPRNWSDTPCGALTMTESGAKGESGTSDVAYCW
jgi:type IV pilus assembly protein PilE